MGVHPSMVTHWKVVSMASMMLSKLVIPWFGPVHFSRQIDSLFLWHRQCKFWLLWAHRSQRERDIVISLLESFGKHLKSGLNRWLSNKFYQWAAILSFLRTIFKLIVFVVNYWDIREVQWNSVGGEWKGDGGFDSISGLYTSVSRNFTNSDICNYLFIGTFHSTIIELNAIYCI